MDENMAIQILNQLREGELKEFRVEKEAFVTFREVLIKQKDMKNFRGNAQRFGAVIYTYEPNWTT